MEVLKFNQDRLTALREAKGWSEVGFAEKLGISRQLLGRIENGDQNPSLPTILKVCGIAKVGIEFFFHWVEEPEPPKKERKRKRDREPQLVA